MKWLRIRKANIDPQLRETFERYGTGTMQMLLANNTPYRHPNQGSMTAIERYLTELLNWLTEQYDIAERKETWSLTMEVAITIFVAAELVLSIVRFVSGN